MKVTFRCIDSPAHHIAATGQKFIGSYLTVDEDDAPAVRAYAASRPLLRIREIRRAAPVSGDGFGDPILEAVAPTKASRRTSATRARRQDSNVVAPVDTTPDVAAAPEVSGQDPAASDEASSPGPEDPSDVAADDGSPDPDETTPEDAP